MANSFGATSWMAMDSFCSCAHFSPAHNLTFQLPKQLNQNSPNHPIFLVGNQNVFSRGGIHNFHMIIFGVGGLKPGWEYFGIGRFQNYIANVRREVQSILSLLNNRPIERFLRVRVHVRCLSNSFSPD
jgi:hypothetical protein